MALQVPIVQKYCSCTDEFYNPTHLAKKQKEFEELRLKGMDNYEALQKMKVVRLCCREALFNPPILFLTSENENRVVNDSKAKIKIDNINTKDILPKKPFPMTPN